MLWTTLRPAGDIPQRVSDPSRCIFQNGFIVYIFLFYKLHLLRTQKTRVILKPSKNIGGVPYAPSQRKQEQAQDRKKQPLILLRRLPKNSLQRKPLPLKLHRSLRTSMRWKQTWKQRRQRWNLSTRKSPELKPKRSKLKPKQRNPQRKLKPRTCWKNCWPAAWVQTISSQSWSDLKISYAVVDGNIYVASSATWYQLAIFESDFSKSKFKMLVGLCPIPFRSASCDAGCAFVPNTSITKKR